MAALYKSDQYFTKTKAGKKESRLYIFFLISGWGLLVKYAYF